MKTPQMINNFAWLTGYDLYAEGDPCPWTMTGDQDEPDAIKAASLRAGWIAARDEAVSASSAG